MTRTCGDCGTPLNSDNPGPRCAECALIDRNERHLTSALSLRRDELLRGAALAQRVIEMREHREEYPK